MRRASQDMSDPDRNIMESTGMPEDPADLDLISEREDSLSNRVHTPPPRLAARFYRPTNNRRKSSAASSRRNSISSVHSHGSSRHAGHAAMAGSQSNYIAQHLRRASILEDRKARLADRAAHAEKVRLRAALAKAAPRSTTNTEERALAAQQAREKNLAEIVASCAEEVKRAKGIAETMKERRELEGKKLRKEMEEKLAEAERRREEILSRNNNTKQRTRSLSSMRKSSSPSPSPSLVAEVKKAPLDEPAAAKIIQTRWRIHRRWKALHDFAELGLTIDGVRETSFEKVVDLLAQEKVLVSTAHILRICGLKEGESGSVNEMTAVRTFLSAFLILGHPTQVLSSKGDKGEQEQDLVAKARDLLISFETVLSRLTTANNYTPPPAQLSTLSEVYATFFNAFIAWKSRDASTLIDMMVLQFVELDSIWQTVKDSTEESVTDSYRDGIRDNQLKLMVRIKRLAGPVQGKRLIANAIREARKVRQTKQPAGDSKPRAAETGSASPVIEDFNASDTAVASHLQTLTPPATPVKERRWQSTDADNLRSVNSILPDNRILVHELAINKEYRISMEDCLQQRGAVNQLIFDSMRQEVAAGNSDPWVLAMADNIKGKLQRLLTPGNSMYKLIEDSLDTDLVASELKNGRFSYETFFNFMGNILPRLCAPFRDDEVKILVETTLKEGDFVDRLQALMRFIDLMQLDYANFMLQQSAPELIKHASTYETKRFSEEMGETNNNLTITTSAWREARQKVYAEAARRDPENVNLLRNRPTPEKTYIQMLADICTSAPGSPVPETLKLNMGRIETARKDTLRIVTTSAILLQVKNILKRDVRSQWKTEASRVYSVLENSKESEQAEQGITAALESSRSMPMATKNHIRELVKRIVAAAAASSANEELREPVMKLLMTRLRGYLIHRLAKESPRNDGNGNEGIAGLGMPEFVAKIGGIVEVMGKMARVDKDAHGIWYEVIERAASDEV
ncbi:c0d120b1-80d5-46ab-a820-51c4c9f0be80 [Sclerotinia trifoliorum]|uniref:C0d120b1-80d5-46ab-a820-51c4c9f0be80 n=1 Tax=Sclerotinia trifoliorum TaxID=28548 RepID=A0A8H2VVJ5_9HELO|nr:c0d120b1-80d5-46ab-a820-51c4c9f0be80 [Sclerotinia trifoliorum]